MSHTPKYVYGRLNPNYTGSQRATESPLQVDSITSDFAEFDNDDDFDALGETVYGVYSDTREEVEEMLESVSDNRDYMAIQDSRGVLTDVYSFANDIADERAYAPGQMDGVEEYLNNVDDIRTLMKGANVIAYFHTGNPDCDAANGQSFKKLYGSDAVDTKCGEITIPVSEYIDNPDYSDVAEIVRMIREDSPVLSNQEYNEYMSSKVDKYVVDSDIASSIAIACVDTPYEDRYGINDEYEAAYDYYMEGIDREHLSEYILENMDRFYEPESGQFYDDEIIESYIAEGHAP